VQVAPRLWVHGRRSSLDSERGEPMKFRFSFPTAMILVCVVAGCGSRQSEATPRTTETPPRREPGEPRVEPKAGEPKVEPKAEETDPEKRAFIKLVQQNADDPSNLEIVLWREKKDGHRQVRFRCNQVGHTRNRVSYRLGTAPPPQKPGNSVMLEEASIEYNGDQIKQVSLARTYQIWRPQ
jgi:hypothetical protein